MVKVFVGVIALKPVRDANAMIRRLHKLVEGKGYTTGDFKVTEYEGNILAGHLHVDERFRADTAENGWLADDGVIKAEVERVLPAVSDLRRADGAGKRLDPSIDVQRHALMKSNTSGDRR